MKILRRLLSLTLTTFLIALAVLVNPGQALADNHSMDVRYLQTCLKQKGASLDVLVLMDSSRSLRNPKSGETDSGMSWTGSDVENRRGPILLSSLNLLKDLAEDSGNSFRVNLKNFGNNSGKDLDALKAKWMPWTEVKSDNSESVLNDFVERALFNDSPGTDWAEGLATARVDFNKRISEAESAGSKSCSIMFWITDGVPTAPKAQVKNAICESGLDSSIDWFREKNILVLGGLLKPKNKDSSLFRPIVTGEDCGNREETWTKGFVIEANDINSLAWEFVNLVANIRNLINLDFKDDEVVLDRGTSQIEIYIKGKPTQWELKAPDGSVFCSSSNVEPTKCVVATGKTNITTISVTPTDPYATQGSWKFTSLPATEVKVYGGISVEPNPAVRLVVDPLNQNVNEGNKASFTARLENADGSLFDISGFKSIKICATLDSDGVEVCKSGSASADLELLPSVSDTTVRFTAVLTSNNSGGSSNNGGDREYNVSAVVNVLVQESGKFPSLVCEGGSEGDTCVIPDLKNKVSKESVLLKVLKPTDAGAVSGQIYIVDIEVTRDDFARNFNFVLTDASGNVVNLGDKTALFNPNDTLNLEVSFDKGGSSQIEGVIKYAVVTGDQIVIRQLNFGFDVGDVVPWWKLILLLLAAYLLTIAVPYAFLLWSARRAAVLNVPGDEFSFLVLPFEITNDGKLMGLGEIPAGATFAPNHKNLEQRSVAPNTRTVTIDAAQISTIPPKWYPFEKVKTRISIPGNYVLPTCSNQSLSYESAGFVSTLVGQAIIYFSAAANIEPLLISSEESIFDDPAFDVYESSYETKISETISSPTNPVSGNVIFIVSPYGHKEKSLTEVLSNLNASASNVNWLEKIAELRENSLKVALEQQEKENAREEVEKANIAIKSKGKKGSIPEKEVSEDWSTSSTDSSWEDDAFLRSEIQDLPDSWNNDDPDKNL
jgi:hypothetical protein